MEAKFNYISKATGKEAEGTLTMQDYKNATDSGMRVSGYLAKKYPDADTRFGDVFAQGQRNLGIHVKSDPSKGILASSVGDILDGVVRPSGLQLASGATIMAPSQQGTTPATRIFYPETVMRIAEEYLIEDYGPEQSAWASMISGTETIQTEQFTQPQIDITAPRAERSQPIAQNALPRAMISITSSQYSKYILTTSIGLQISDQAQRNSSIDLVTVPLRMQMEGEANAKLWEDMGYVVSGNTDAGQAALSATAATGYDSAATGGVMTQKAWMSVLTDPDRKVSYDSMLCDSDTLLAVQKRLDRPVMFDPRTSGGNVGNLGSYGFNVEPVVLNIAHSVPQTLVVPDGIVPVSNLLLFDSRYGLRRVVNASASYTAMEQAILQRSSFFRFDAGALTYRLMDEAFLLLDFS